MFYRFTIETPLSGPEVAERLRPLIRTRRGFVEALRYQYFLIRRKDSDPSFIGKVDAVSFQMHRDIRYSNSFMPLLRGRIEPSASGSQGSQVRVTMALHPFVFAFMTFWFSGMGVGAVMALTSTAFGNQLLRFMPAGMFVFVAALVYVSFFPEAIIARRLLEKALSPPQV